MNLSGEIIDPSGGNAALFNYGALEGLGAVGGYYSVAEIYAVGIGIDAVNDGTFATTEGFAFGGAVTGTGTIEVGQITSFQSSVSSGQTVEFAPTAFSGPFTYTPAYPTLTLNDPLAFAGVITGFDQGGGADEQIDVNSSWTFESFAPNADSTGGALMLADGAAQAAVTLSGQYDPTGFHAAPSNNGPYTTITYSG